MLRAYSSACVLQLVIQQTHIINNYLVHSSIRVLRTSMYVCTRSAASYDASIIWYVSRMMMLYSSVEDVVMWVFAYYSSSTKKKTRGGALVLFGDHRMIYLRSNICTTMYLH